LAESWRQLQEFEQAIPAYQAAISLNDQVAQYHSGLGESLRRLGNCEEAVVAFEQALEIDANNQRAIQGLSACRP
jgi:Flp pilus assembly protein TadD